MNFNSAEFLIFLPAVVSVYYLIPKKYAYLWLLAASYYFYMCWDAVYALLILASTAVTYSGGLAFGGCRSGKRKKVILAVCIVTNILILFWFKYSGFAFDAVTQLFAFFGLEIGIPEFDVILPVGISFYTFQALGYLIDVYRGDTAPEKNFFRYALFVSFFPQLVAGPIERSGHLLGQLRCRSRFSYDAFRKGIFIMLWGFFLKLVIADRAAVFVDAVYADTDLYSGAYMAVAALLFSIQIYCDFYAYSVIAMGSAMLLGIELTENFNAPYLSSSVGEFWRNWHISLMQWFRDYIYIPLGGNKKGRLRTRLNRLTVFFVSGLWHGADYKFVVWGLLNGAYQLAGEALAPVRRAFKKLVRAEGRETLFRPFSVIFTFFIITAAWIFFRAGDVFEAWKCLTGIFTTANYGILADGGIFGCGLDAPNLYLLLAAICILLFADVCKRKRIVISEFILARNGVLRAVFFALAVNIILLFGIWGPEYDVNSFIYFQF